MRRLTLHCALRSAVLSVAVLFLSSAIVEAQQVATPKRTRGSLQVMDVNGKLGAELLLKHTAVKATVSGFISRVTVTQDFSNQFPQNIHAVYHFPLPEGSAVDDLTMQIGGRNVTGKIIRSEDAQAAYGTVRSVVRIAFLPDQEGPNIFAQPVANIPPGQSVRIVLSYVETLKYHDGSYEWSFPMVVTPRYHPAENTPGEADGAARISPRKILDRLRAGHDISIDVDLNSGVPLIAVNSETHETDVQLVGDRRARVQLRNSVTIPDKDFVLKYRVAGSSLNDAVLTHRSERGGFFTLILQPPQRVAAPDPLMTDISIDWSGLPVTDIYPRRVPDFAGDKPLIFAGHYTAAAKGTIRISGKSAGQNFVRTIPIELPEVEPEHGVLATFWARAKVDELMREQDQNREEIGALGLSFKLKTQYTSLVAVDEVMFIASEGGDVSVPVAAAHAPTGTMAAASCSWLVYYPDSLMQGISANILEGSPLQGRSYLTVGQLRRGSITEKAEGVVVHAYDTSLSYNGADAHLVVDKSSANFTIAPGGESPGPTASGSKPALTASGGANSLAPLSSIQEGIIGTFSRSAEYGRTPGTHFEVTTSSGKNYFQGSAFHAFGNDSFDANDWFANSRGLAKPPKRLNQFGGALGGLFWRDRIFFFGAYEGMRLRQPMVGVTDVPSILSRTTAPSELRPFLNAFPLPTGATRPDGFAEFASVFANPANHDVGSLKIDYNVTPYLSLKARYNFADSSADKRGSDRLSLNTINRVRSRAQVVTGSMSYAVTPNILVEAFANYSRSRVNGSYEVDAFGGATIPSFNPEFFNFDLNSRSAGWMIGDDTASWQRQVHVGGSFARVQGKHYLRFGADYRRLSPIIGVRTAQQSVWFNGVARALTGIAGRQSLVNHVGPQEPVFETVSLFGQDQWRVHSRFTLNYGLRWEVAPAPSAQNTIAVDQITDPATLKATATNRPLWKTTFGNLGPRINAAFMPFDQNPEILIRGGVGALYDLGYGSAGDLFATSIPFISGSSVFNSPLSTSIATPASLPFKAFDPSLKLPYAINWDLVVEWSIGSRQTFTAGYVGSTSRRLLHTETLFNQNPDFDFLRLTSNRGRSDHRALQVTFRRTFADGFAAAASYTLSNSRDNVTLDSERTIVMTSADPSLDRGPSDYDVRHRLIAFASYQIPAFTQTGLANKLSRNWIINSIINGRSAKPSNPVYLFPTSLGVAFLRPDRAEDVPFYVLDPPSTGGQRLNALAFRAPADLEQGSLPRNSLRGFPLYQFDVGLLRKFNFTDNFSLQIAAEAFNVLNHPNFADPSGNDLVIGTRLGAFTPNLAFGESRSLAGRSLSSGGFASFYGNGGARTMKFSLKLAF